MTSSSQVSQLISANEKLLNFLPVEWGSFLKKAIHQISPVNLLLLEDNSLDKKRYPIGWSIHCLGDIQQAIFAPEGRAYFSLSYDSSTSEVIVRVRIAFETFVKLGVMYGMLIALHRTCVGLHGVTLSCGNQIIVLSAPSGTGKTTLANLLVEHCGARIINGDFALLSFDDNRVIFEPTPFCGSSGICLNERVAIDRIIFLSQNKENIWYYPTGRAAIRSILDNVFIPTFDSLLSQDIQKHTVLIASSVKINDYAFAPTKEAATMFYDRIQQ